MDAGENTINSNEKQDVMIYIRFVRGHWKIYIVAVLLTELVESVSDRDFMDDAAAIMGQEIMLEKVEQDAVVF